MKKSSSSRQFSRIAHMVIGTCNHNTQLLMKKEEGKLTPFQQLELKWHLFFCKYCTRFMQQTNSIVQAFRQSGQTRETIMNAQKKEAIKTMLKNEQ